MNIDLQTYEKSKPNICKAHDRHNDMNKEMVYDQIDRKSNILRTLCSQYSHVHIHQLPNIEHVLIYLVSHPLANQSKWPTSH
jgi:hypothetical protein